MDETTREHYAWARGWGRIAVKLLGFHIPTIPEWRKAVIDGFVAGVSDWAESERAK
jgi:hypothetical protein